MVSEINPIMNKIMKVEVVADLANNHVTAYIKRFEKCFYKECEGLKLEIREDFANLVKSGTFQIYLNNDQVYKCSIEEN